MTTHHIATGISPEQTVPFTPVPNHALEWLFGPECPLTQRQTKVLLVVWRFTYGFSRNSAALSSRFVAEATGLDDSDCRKALKALVNDGYLTASYARKIGFYTLRPRMYKNKSSKPLGYPDGGDLPPNDSFCHNSPPSGPCFRADYVQQYQPDDYPDGGDSPPPLKQTVSHPPARPHFEVGNDQGFCTDDYPDGGDSPPSGGVGVNRPLRYKLPPTPQPDDLPPSKMTRSPLTEPSSLGPGDQPEPADSADALMAFYAARNAPLSESEEMELLIALYSAGEAQEDAFAALSRFRQQLSPQPPASAPPEPDPFEGLF
jgi:phage replication O-like protein O